MMAIQDVQDQLGDIYGAAMTGNDNPDSKNDGD